MVVLHGRKLLKRAPRSILLVLLALLAACGENSDATEGTRADRRDPATSGGEVAHGDPMPAAERAGGIPPYPGAVVWTLPRPPSEFEAMEAFTPDSFLQVVAFYDRELAEWRRTVAQDAVHYHRDPNLATVIVSPWNGAAMGEDGPEELRRSRTSIGAAWKKGL